MTTAPITLLIDSREPALWECLLVLAREDEASGITLERAQMDLGDACIRVGQTEVLLFERKAFSDLASSLKDGRFKEQKSRILAHWLARRVTYVIEGAPSFTDWARRGKQPFHGLSGNVLVGMICNTMYRDGIHVGWTRDVSDTAMWLWSLALKTVAKPTRYGPSGVMGVEMDPENNAEEQHERPSEAPLPSAPVTLKRRKCENVTPASCWIDQLCQIPQISNKIATEIARAYPTPRIFTAALEAAESPTALVAMLPGIGQKKAQNVCAFMGWGVASPHDAGTF